MKRSIFYILGFIALVIFSISCVSAKKFSSLQDTSKHFMNERDAFKTDNIGLEMQNKELKARLAKLQKEADTVQKEITSAQNERDKAVDEYNKMSTKYTELQNAQEDLIKGNVKETQKLLADLQTAQANLQKKEDLLRQLGQNLDTKKASLDELTFELEKKNARLAELEKYSMLRKR